MVKQRRRGRREGGGEGEGEGGGVRAGGGWKRANIDRFGLKVHNNYYELLWYLALYIMGVE